MSYAATDVKKALTCKTPTGPLTYLRKIDCTCLLGKKNISDSNKTKFTKQFVVRVAFVTNMDVKSFFISCSGRSDNYPSNVHRNDLKEIHKNKIKDE